MTNHEYVRKSPTYFIINQKIKKCGFFITIIIRNIFNGGLVIIFQNAFLILEKYMDHVHTYSGIEVKVATKLKKKY